MKVIRLYGPRDLRVDDVSAPEPGVGEALIRVRAVGVCGSDVHYYLDGRIGDDVAPVPFTLGHELSSDIVALGTVGDPDQVIDQPEDVELAPHLEVESEQGLGRLSLAVVDLTRALLDPIETLGRLLSVACGQRADAALDVIEDPGRHGEDFADV